jgi:hypothetical protein
VHVEVRHRRTAKPRQRPVLLDRDEWAKIKPHLAHYGLLLENSGAGDSMPFMRAMCLRESDRTPSAMSPSMKHVSSGGGTTALCLSTNISFIFSMEPNGRSREVITPGVAEVVVAGH